MERHGIVDEDIEPAVFGKAFDRGHCGGAIGNVAAQGHKPAALSLVRHPLKRVAIDVQCADGRAARNQVERDRAPEPISAARDDGAQSFQHENHLPFRAVSRRASTIRSI